MNSYNENLYSTVLNSLQTLQLNQAQAAADANAAMFTLYHAEGATITAGDKLEQAKIKQAYNESVKTQAVHNNNISVNLLAAANQSVQYQKQSVSNSAVAASNMQIAANAVLRLASDMGSAFNIVQAADFGTDIFNQAREANQLIRRTAYVAEFASQLSMEASILTAEVSVPTVQAKAAATNTAMGNLLTVLSAQYDAVSQEVTADNAALATASATEKQAEGSFNDLDTISDATSEAYQIANGELNNSLTATPLAGQESTTFTVSFKPIRSPFRESNNAPFYPVKDYYLFVVKDKQKATFSITVAEDILQNQMSRFINLQIGSSNTDQQGNTFSASYNYLAIPNANGQPYTLRDTDGDPITTGVNYVVFFLAVYEQEYKKKLNVFDDYLSAPSATFTLTNYLAAAQNVQAPLPSSAGEPGATQTVTFSVTEDPAFAGQVEYRCILLPLNSTPGVPGMATVGSLAELEDEIKNLETISIELDPKIATLESNLLALNTAITTQVNKYPEFFPEVEDVFNKFATWLTSMLGSQTVEEVAEIFIQILKSENNLAATASADLLADLKAFVISLLNQYVDKTNLRDLKTKKSGLEMSISAAYISRINFIFNLTLAEQVPAGNYLTATRVVTPLPEQPSGDSAAPKAGKGKKSAGNTAGDNPEVFWSVEVNDAATDNFGNMLLRGIPNAFYTPVIVSVSTAPEENQPKFTNAWTGFDKTPLMLFN